LSALILSIVAWSVATTFLFGSVALQAGPVPALGRAQRQIEEGGKLIVGQVFQTTRLKLRTASYIIYELVRILAVEGGGHE
jgi:hypothetical protein